MATTGVTIRRIERARTAARRSDYLLVLVTLALLAVGLMMVYSTTFDWAYQATGNPLTYFLRQMIWAALGLVGMAVLSRVDYGWWRRLAVPVLVLAVGALILVLLVGDETFGARRTLLRGSLQPSEPAKLALVIYVAAWLSSKGEKLRRITYGLVPFSVLIGVVVGLIVLEPDFSTAILITLVAGAMFFVAGADLLQILIGGLVGGGTFYLLITHSAHASQRLADYVAAWHRPEQASHHVRQALIALGSGGIFGRGLGAGYQKFGYLPAPHTDSIFAVVGEELGLVGCLLVIGLFALLAQRGFKIALEARDGFGALLASGITFWLIFQTLINIAVMTAVVPFTGIPLPFLSAGGSSLVSCLAAVGVLLSVSRGSRLEVEGRASAFLRGWDRRTRLSRPGRR